MKALGRLSEREAYDRIHRFRVASQQSVLHKNLPKEQWIKPEEVRVLVKLRVQVLMVEICRMSVTLGPTSRK